MDERPIPEAALHAENAIEMLRVWTAKGGPYCSIKIGQYRDPAKISEEKAWGIILADVVILVSNAIAAEYSRDKDEVLAGLLKSHLSFLKKLGVPIPAADAYDA